MVASHLARRPGLAALPRPALLPRRLDRPGAARPRRRPGRPQRDRRARTVGALLRPYTFPPLDLALDPNWDRKLAALAERSLREPITLVSGVSSWLVALFQRLLELSGKATVAEVWPALEIVVHGGVKFDPYRETFARPGRLPDDPAPGELSLLRGVHRLRRPGDGPAPAGASTTGSSTSSSRSTSSARTGRPGTGWATSGRGSTTRSSSRPARGSGRTSSATPSGSSRSTPPLLTFTGRTKYTLSAFGEHLISEEVEAAVAGGLGGDRGVGPRLARRPGLPRAARAITSSSSSSSGPRPTWPPSAGASTPSCRRRNAHYQWFRAEGGGLPLPALIVARPGGFDDWMRSRGKLGGQHKVPRMDSSGTLTAELVSVPPGLASRSNGGCIAGSLTPASGTGHLCVAGTLRVPSAEGERRHAERACYGGTVRVRNADEPLLTQREKRLNGGFGHAACCETRAGRCVRQAARRRATIAHNATRELTRPMAIDERPQADGRDVAVATESVTAAPPARPARTDACGGS